MFFVVFSGDRVRRGSNWLPPCRARRVVVAVVVVVVVVVVAVVGLIVVTILLGYQEETC